MIPNAETASSDASTTTGRGEGSRLDQDVSYESFLQTMQTFSLRQDDDYRHLARTVILGEN